MLSLYELRTTAKNVEKSSLTDKELSDILDVFRMVNIFFSARNDSFAKKIITYLEDGVKKFEQMAIERGWKKGAGGSWLVESPKHRILPMSGKYANVEEMLAEEMSVKT